MLFDDAEDMGRAFNIVIKGSISQLVALHSKEAECWVRIFKIVKEMNINNCSIADKNPFVFEKE
jgi:hypothetical protein